MLGRLERLEQRLDQLEASASNHAPMSEVERLNHAFDLIAGKSPVSEVERLNKAFELIEGRALASESERLDRAFDLIEERAPSSEIDRLNHAIDLIANHRPSERIVEIPWVLSKYEGEERVLEVGYAFAEDHYLRNLVSLAIPLFVGIDAAASPRAEDLLASIAQVRGDVLQGCFRPGSFELILCVSTIEHIGRDNSIYGIEMHHSFDEPDIEAMQAMSQWLGPSGRLLLTVPYGRYEDHGWLINYDKEHLERLLASSELEVEERRFFGWAPGGWREVESDEIADRGYQSLGASHAAGVALVELRAPRNP